MKTSKSLWRCLEPRCSRLALRLTSPNQTVWLCLQILTLSTASILVFSMNCLLPYLSPVFSGMTQTVWIAEPLLFGSLSQQPARLVTVNQDDLWQNISVLLTPVCVTWMQSSSDLQSQALPRLSRLGFTFSPKQHHMFAGEKGSDPFTVASCTCLCLSNLRASIDFHWIGKKRNLIHKLLLTSTSYFLHRWVLLEGREWTKCLQFHNQCVYTSASVAGSFD